MTVTVDSECLTCGGTGVKGNIEFDGIAELCIVCKGTGNSRLTYTPFTGRKRRDNVRLVQFCRGITPLEKCVSYEEFLAGKMPQTGG